MAALIQVSHSIIIKYKMEKEFHSQDISILLSLVAVEGQASGWGQCLAPINCYLMVSIGNSMTETTKYNIIYTGGTLIAYNTHCMLQILYSTPLCFTQFCREINCRDLRFFGVKFLAGNEC